MPGGPRVNLTSASEHVPEIERHIRVVKERSRSSRHSLPFNRIPRLLTIHIVFTAVKLLNHFPPKGGISETVSPKTIMTGETLDYKKHLSLQLGQYCQVHEDDTPRNSQLPRTQGAICLGPSGNLQGDFKFINLNTAKKISRQSWDIIPMPQTVIDQVNILSKDQPEQFIFTVRKGRLIGDVEPPSINELLTSWNHWESQTPIYLLILYHHNQQRPPLSLPKISQECGGPQESSFKRNKTTYPAYQEALSMLTPSHNWRAKALSTMTHICSFNKTYINLSPTLWLQSRHNFH
jgi:hypothetical protein